MSSEGTTITPWPPPPDLKKASLRRARHVAVGVDLPHQAHRGVRVPLGRLAAQFDVVGGNELLFAPAAFLQDGVEEAQVIGRAQSDVAAARSMRQNVFAAAHGPGPLAPAQRFRETHVNVLVHLHAGQIAQDDRRDVRRGGGVGVAAAGLGPERRAQGRRSWPSGVAGRGTGVSLTDGTPFTKPGLLPSPCSPADMESNWPSVMSAFAGSSSGMASGRYFALKTLVSRPSGIWAFFSASMMPQAMLV